MSKMSPAKVTEAFLTPWKLKWYFLQKLPTAFWWGLRVRYLSEDRCEVQIPFNWRTQNPFNSIYFAALAGAGELSTGAMALVATLAYGNISMLVVEQKAEFYKKANSEVRFVCEQGQEVRHVIQQAIDKSEAQQLTMHSNGYNSVDEMVCKVSITWSFRVRSQN